jgi:hypothetical protein
LSEEAKSSNKEAELKILYVEYRMMEHCDLKHVLNMMHTFKFDFKVVRFLGKDSIRVWDKLLRTITVKGKADLFNTLETANYEHVRRAFYNEGELKQQLLHLLHNEYKPLAVRALVLDADRKLLIFKKELRLKLRRDKIMHTRTINDVSLLKICADDEPEDSHSSCDSQWQLQYIMKKLLFVANDFLHQIVGEGLDKDEILTYA